jgi:putative spermidine/putrescine transport system permease protein
VPDRSFAKMGFVRGMSNRKIRLLLAPALIVLGSLSLGGLALVVLRSLRVQEPSGQEVFGIDAYAAVLSQPEFLGALGFGLYISVTATALATGIAIAAALVLRRRHAGRGIVSFLFQVTLTVPHLIGALGILYLLSQSGLIARLAYGIGVIDRPSQFPALVYDRYGIGIILQYVWKEVPFIALIVLAQMQTLGNDFESVARSLGASRRQSFRHVLLPLILPGVIGASVLVFGFTFGAYEVPLILGPNAPTTLPVLAYRKFTDVDPGARAEAMALAVVMTAISASLVAGYILAARRSGGPQ